MKRTMYLQMPALFIGAAILSVIGLVGWVILLIPVMIYPKLTRGFSMDAITGAVTKKMMQSAMRKSRA